MKWKILVTVLVVIRVYCCGSICKPEYEVNENVQLMYKYYPLEMTWYEAYKECKKDYGKLAMPTNIMEMNAVLDAMKNFHNCKKTDPPLHISLGFHDQFRLEEYVTETGLPIQYVYHTFSPDEKNKGNKRCGSVQVKTMKLYSIECGHPIPFVCQRDLSPNTTDPDECPFTRTNKYKWMTGQPHNWGFANCGEAHHDFFRKPQYKSVYKLHLNAKRWPLARTICETEGGYLAIIDDEKEKEMLVKFVNLPENVVSYSDRNSIWLGYHDYFKIGEFVTVKGDDFLHSVKTLIADDKKTCGAMDEKGDLKMMDCSLFFKFICEKKIVTDMDCGNI